MRILVFLSTIILLTSCGIYSMRMVADDSGAETFSVDYFTAQTPKATQIFTTRFTEELKDFINDQSSLTWVKDRGELQFSGAITGYNVAPKSIQSNETAGLMELRITVNLKYTNTIETDKSFDRSFSKSAVYNSSQELYEVEEDLWEDIIEQLMQSIYNDTLGNW